MKIHSKTTRHWHVRRTSKGMIPVREHFMKYWQNLTPEQKQEGQHSFLRIAFNRAVRTRDAALMKQVFNTISTRQKEQVVGGLADQIPDDKFPQDQLAKGIKVEMEHTNDPKVAKEISKDHLIEDIDYYKKLEIMEKGGKLLDELEAGKQITLSDEDKIAVMQEQERRLYEARKHYMQVEEYSRLMKEGKVW